MELLKSYSQGAKYFGDITVRLPAMQWLWVALTTLVLLADVATAYDNCQTRRTEIHLTKAKTYDYNGRRMRLFCAGSALLNTCEGTCMSQVSPSVVHFPGFKKDCKCCRESRLVDRLVTLKTCYAGNERAIGQEVSIMVKEPVECQCFDCAI